MNNRFFTRILVSICKCDNIAFDKKFYQYTCIDEASEKDLRYQAKLYLKKSNNIPMAILNYKTPNEMRKLLLNRKN